MPAGWPQVLWLVRHGESVGNAAAATAPVNCGITFYQLHEERGLVLRSYNASVDRDGQLEPAGG